MAGAILLQQALTDITLQGLLDSIKELFSFDGQIVDDEFCYNHNIETDLSDVEYIKGLAEQFHSECEETDERDKIIYAFNSIMEWYENIAVFGELFEYSIVFKDLYMSMATAYQYDEY